MKKIVLLTGGGTGGHVFPLIAVADEIRNSKFSDTELVYIGPKSPLDREFTDRGIPAYRIASSKLRRYFSLANFVDVPKFVWSVFQALLKLYFLMPDVVFSKGGPGAFAVVLAAKFYMIPIVIQESDAAPGLTNRLSAKFAERIGIAFESAAAFFNKNKVFVCGNPLRRGLAEGGVKSEFMKPGLGFKKDPPLIFVWGGSQGAAKINGFVFDNLEMLLKRYQIYHQVGEGNLKDAQSTVQSTLKEMPEFDERYKLAGFLDMDGVKTALSAADAVLARAGAGSIFEIAAFGKPAVLVPLEGSANGHQKANAYEYAKTGAAIVIEEANLTPNIVSTQLDNIVNDENKAAAMSAAAKKFSRPDSASVIAQEILKIR